MGAVFLVALIFVFVCSGDFCWGATNMHEPFTLSSVEPVWVQCFYFLGFLFLIVQVGGFFFSDQHARTLYTQLRRVCQRKNELNTSKKQRLAVFVSSSLCFFSVDYRKRMYKHEIVHSDLMAVPGPGAEPCRRHLDIMPTRLI